MKKKISIHIFNLIIVAVVLLTIDSCSQKEPVNSDEAVLKGKVENVSDSFILLRKNVPGAANDTIRLKDGSFVIKLKPDTLTAYTLIFGDRSRIDTIGRTEVNKRGFVISTKTQETILMLDKSYDLSISFDAKDFANSYKLSGNGAELNEYVIKKNLVNLNFNIEYSNKLNSKWSEFSPLIDGYKQNIEQIINNISSGSRFIPEGFKESEKKNSEYMFERLKINFAKVHAADKPGAENYFAPDENYFSFMKELPMNSTEELSNPAYMMLISSYADYVLAKNNPGINISPEDEFRQKYDIYRVTFTNAAARDIVLYDMLKKNGNYLEMKWYKDVMDDYIKTAANDSLKKEILSVKEKRSHITKGNPAPDFSYPDVDGVKHSLSEYKGKYVYIDVWATWCKPCLYEAPYMKTIAKEYKGRNIVFLGVSIDEDTLKWKKMVSENDMPGVQINSPGAETGFMKDYVIGGIPRFILIGPRGEIIAEDAPKPSMPELKQLLESYSGL
ncbi:MAG: TlpA disulfide reductase family protein [bacterium]